VRGLVAQHLSTKGSDMRVLAAMAVVLALSAVPVLAGDFEDGFKAYNGKDYARAMEFWNKAAAKGSAPRKMSRSAID